MFVGDDTKREYKLINGENSHSLIETMEERDLGIVVRNDLKPSSQCSATAEAAAASKGMSVVGLVNRNFKKFDVDT